MVQFTGTYTLRVPDGLWVNQNKLLQEAGSFFNLPVPLEAPQAHRTVCGSSSAAIHCHSSGYCRPLLETGLPHTAADSALALNVSLLCALFEGFLKGRE